MYLEDDLIETDEVLGLGSPLGLVIVRLLELGLQRVSHALVPLHYRAQLDVAQVARTPHTHALQSHLPARPHNDKLYRSLSTAGNASVRCTNVAFVPVQELQVGYFATVHVRAPLSLLL